MANRVLLRRRNITVTRDRALQVGAVLVLLVLGIAVPFYTVTYLDNSATLTRSTEPLFGASALLGGLDPTFLPSFNIATVDSMRVALNVSAAAPGIMEVGTMIALVTCGGLFMDEINKFFWWPLHVSGYLLIIAVVPTFVGAHLLRANAVVISTGPGWLAGLLAGVLILVLTFRSHKRIDSYAGI